MTREIGITKTFMIVMTWTVRQQTMPKRKARGAGAAWRQRAGGMDLAQNREPSSHASAAKPADLSPGLGAGRSV